MSNLINWKLITVILVSLILLALCYLTLDLQKFFSKKEEKSINFFEHKINKKIKIDFQKEDDFKKIKLPEGFLVNHTIYYFPDKCPDYKLGFFLIDNENDLENYYVPEEKHIIIVNKEHIWTKTPDFNYWKLEY